jgi:hypothetical protein
MRVSHSMLWRLSAGILGLFLLILAVVPVFAADTGTYSISDYAVTLEPQSDGQVKITVNQQWQVLSGNIPWVTVGLPNSKFSLEDWGGAAVKASPVNESGFQGVRLDLDKNYTAGQSFKVNFTVMQGNLLERLTEEKKWRIDYIPGWYDRAVTGHLRVDFISPVESKTYSTILPEPSSVNGNVMTWEVSNLGAGRKLHLTLESLDGNFLAETVPIGKTASKGIPVSVWVIVIIVALVGLFIFLRVRQKRQQMDLVKQQAMAIEKEMAMDKVKKVAVQQDFEEYVEKKNIKPDAEGRYYDRSYGYITPAIYAAIITNQMRTHSTMGGSGYRTGCVSSCACACVSCACACACACAGGGAAGCSRKTLHDCRECRLAAISQKDDTQETKLT